jgi:hypothetical protein
VLKAGLICKVSDLSSSVVATSVGVFCLMQHRRPRGGAIESQPVLDTCSRSARPTRSDTLRSTCVLMVPEGLASWMRRPPRSGSSSATRA